MQLPWLGEHTPSPTLAALGPDSDAPGLLAAGGGLDVPRLREAYRHGIFPGMARASPSCGGARTRAWCCRWTSSA
jgi:leucyl/phenylalanyl-tRNA--protein transferase